MDAIIFAMLKVELFVVGKAFLSLITAVNISL